MGLARRTAARLAVVPSAAPPNPLSPATLSRYVTDLAADLCEFTSAEWARPLRPLRPAVVTLLCQARKNLEGIWPGRGYDEADEARDLVVLVKAVQVLIVEVAAALPDGVGQRYAGKIDAIVAKCEALARYARRSSAASWRPLLDRFALPR